ncbi:holo-ACP synthase [Clostridium oceanicum]|uniref:Holo-[acyl-carrier-protein] synthase n=1 Tax=Clostridium oceanicum TaxID=1543 RepID=A0ABN1JAH7_9CLOT
MIKGIGTDIIEIHRIKKAIDRNENFIKNLFTEKEVIYFKNKKNMQESIAGRFAAKEAISKALGTGFRRFGFKDIEVLNDKLGKPIVNLYGNALNIAKDLGEYKIHVSISHSKKDAIAYALLEVIL